MNRSMRYLLASLRRSESGGSTVEFAIMACVLTPLMLYAVFFYELSLVKLKTQEASRYMVWEMTVMDLSDWQNEKHDSKFNSVKGTITNEVIQRWGDDLDGATPTFTGGTKLGGLITANVTIDPNQAELKNLDAGIVNMNVAGVSTGGLGKGIDKVFEHFGFNTKGKVTGNFQIKATNKFLGKMPVVLGGDMLMSQEFTFKSQQSLIADQWDIKEGGPVQEAKIKGGCTTNYCKQVHRMAFLGISDLLGGLNIGDLLSYADVHWPLDTVVFSKPVVSDGNNSSRTLRVHDIKKPAHSPLRLHYTNVYKDRRVANESEYYKTFKKLGNYYMGCKEKLKLEGDCEYK